MRMSIPVAVAAGLLFAAMMFAAGCSSNDSAGETPMPNGEQASDLRMEDYAWSHRPLVVFASAGDTPELERQRDLLRAARAGLIERDMVVIEVIGRERGRVDGKALTDAAVARLVERYDPPVDAFEVLLIGKDTGVKLRRDEPVTAETLFELIDAMPMRQREMRDNS